MSGAKVSNMFRIFIVHILALLALAGCASPMEKSVMEPLQAGELDKVAGKDISFLATYSIVQDKWNRIETPQDSARWAPLTYARLHSFIKATESDSLNSPLFSKLRSEWEQINISANAKADSLIHYWKDFLKSNSPDSLLSVSLEDVEFEKIRNIKKNIDTLVRVELKLKGLRGSIDSATLSYAFSLNSPADTTSVADTLAPVQTNYLYLPKRISDSISIKVFPALSSNLKRSLIQRDSSVVFSYVLHSVYTDGKCYNEDTLRSRVPEPVLELIDAQKEDISPVFDSNEYRERIIKELIDKDYVSQRAFLRHSAQEHYKLMDTLAYSYLNYRGSW